jgi:HK97 gp10 family phage protein
MLTLDVVAADFSSFLQDVQEAGVNAEPLMKAALSNSATNVQSNVRNRAPHRTGALQGSVLTDVSYPAAIVSVNQPYGAFVEYGTAPHIITPVNKKALFWSGAFSPVKSVMHPGTKANPFFQTGVDDSSDYVDNQFMRVVEKLIQIMAGH